MSIKLRTCCGLAVVLAAAMCTRDGVCAGAQSDDVAASHDSCESGCRPKRLGDPHRVAWYAVTSERPAYSGYYVGGGATWRGEAPTVHEGTWGWDYFGPVFSRRVDLGWWHGRRYQGGGGAYKTDGPKLRE